MIVHAACSSFQPVALSLTHVPKTETVLPTLGIGRVWLGMTSVISVPCAAERLTPFISPLEAASGVTLTWQSPSCSTCVENTVPFTVRHGFDPSRTVS